MAKKKNKLLETARQAAQIKYNNTPKQSNAGVTQSMIDNEIKRRDTYAQSQKATAPTAVRGGSGSFGDLTKYRATGDSNMYYGNEQRASERMKERGSSSAYNPFPAGNNTRYGAQNSLQRQAEEKQRQGYDVKLKNKTSAGTRRTYSNLDGTQGTYYEKNRMDNPTRTAFNKSAVPSRISNQMTQNPSAKIDTNLAKGAKRQTGINLDPSQFMTQESANTLKYDDGKRTEYYERQGDSYVSVPEERYNQIKLLDAGKNPATYTAADRVIDTAKARIEGWKASAEGILSSSDVGRENKGYQLAMKYQEGDVLSPKQEEFMRSTKAGQAVLNGDIQAARALVNEETKERSQFEQKALADQQASNKRAETAKIGTGKAGAFLLDLEGTALDMAPGMALNAVAPGAFLTEMAFQSYGNSYNQARLNGASHDEAVLSGIQNAAVETLSEMMFAGGKALGKATGVRGIFHPGKEIEAAALGFVKTTRGKDLVRTVQKLGLASAEEGAEEFVAGIAEPVLDAMIYQGGFDQVDWEQTLHDALYNTLVGAAMGGGFGAVDVAQSIRQGADIRAHADVANMINQGLAMPEDTKAYSLARSLDNQVKAGQSLSNLDVSDLSKAVQEQHAEISKRVSKEQDNTDRVMKREGLVHRSSSAQTAYDQATEQTDAEGSRVEMSAQGREYEKHYDNAKRVLTDRLMPAMAEEVSEDPDVVEANRADAERQAEDGARTIARVMMGEATVEDFQKFGTTNPALREAYEEITGTSIPEGNKAAADFMISQNENHYIAEQRDDKTRAMLAYVDAVFGDKSTASEAFRKSIGDLSNVDANELEGVIRGFSDAYTIGRASEPDAVLPRKTDMMKFLSDEQIEAAFQAGKNDRLARSEMVMAAEEKIAAAKKNGKRKSKIKHDVASNLNEEERNSEKAKQAIEDMQILQDAMNVKIILETARTTKESGNPERAEGWYDKDGIHLNIDADTKVKPLEVVFSHEFTHHLQRYAPKEYQALVEFVIEAKTNNNMQAWERMVEQKMVDYGNAGVELTRDQAIDEIVADMAYEFLNNEQTVERLFAYDATLADKIKSVMLNMIDKILKFFKTHGSQWKGMESDLNKARQMWLEAAEAARENAGLSINGSTQYAVGDTDPANYTDKTLKRELNEIAKGTYTENSYIPVRRNTPQVLIDSINAYNENVVIKDYPVMIRVGKIQQAMAPITTGQKRKRGHGLSEPDLVAIIGKMDNPTKIILQKRGNYAEIVEHVTQKGNKVWVAFTFGDNYNPDLLNGYIPGTYNTITTMFSPDDYETYLRENMAADIPIVTKKASSEEAVPEKGASHSEGVPSSDNNVSETEQSRNQNTQKEQDAVDFENNVVDSDKQFSISESQMDPDLVKRLNNEKKVKVYRAMQYIDGRLYPPMAAVVKGDLNGGTELGKWEQAEERPDLVVNENGKEYFVLNKGNGKSIKARYNPYIHTSLSPLNDQFSSAYARPNMVVVEGYVPESELTSGYKAEKAKDSVGETQWKAGPVAGKLGKIGKPRRVILSRYFKPERVIPDTEVAGMIADIMDGTGISIPANVVTPTLREELETAGVEIDYENVPKAFNDSQTQFSIAEDSKGHKLSKGQQEYFKNSKARDEQGRLRVLYHSSPEQFYEFDNDKLGSNTGYSNTAFGHFVTDYKPFSERFGENQMELYADIEKLAIHPFGAAAKYNSDELEQITRDWLELTDPEQLNVYEEYKQDDPDLSLYDFYMDLWVGEDPFDYAEDQRELLEDAGYDGVELFEGNENQLSGDNSGEEKPVTTYAVFNSNQLKDVTNESPTDNPDIRYSLSEDTSGRTLTAAQREFFKDSKIRDEQGRLKVMYHGTNNEFTVFDFSQGGKNGTAEGYGIYTSDREDVSRHYGGRLIEGYVNITRPAASDQKTIKRSELKKLIRATVDAEAQRLAEDYDGDVAAAAKDTWISNYTYTYDKSLDAAIDEVAGKILDLNDNDMDIVQEVMVGMAIRDYNEAEQFYDVLTDVTGIDGFVTDWEDSNTGESSRIALAFRSNQIKNVTNESPTEDPDIRYSISTPMSELDHTDKTVADSNGNPVAKFDRAGGVQFSISTYEDKGRAVLNKYLDKMLLEGELDQDEAEQIRAEMEKIYDICKEYADSGRYIPFSAWSSAEVITGPNGRPIFSAVKNNSEYKMNMDFSTICKKRRTLDAIFNELVNRGFFDRFDFNKEDSAAFVVKMNDIIRKNGFEAACALCFVEARRYRQQQTAMTFRDMWNDLVLSMYKDESKISHFNFGQDSTARMVEDGIHTMKDSELDLTYVKKMAKGKGVPARAAKLLLEDPSQRKLMRTGDMMSSVGFENFQVKDPKLMKIYNAKKGTGGAKSSFGDVQYFHEIIGSRGKTFNRNKAYKVGGVRIQSFSDYVPRMVFDYVEMVADLAAKRLPAHAYTKEALFAKQFGLTGIKINLSLVPDVIKGAKVVGLDKDGNYAWNVEGTFPYDEAEKLIHAEGYKENVGTIAVGVSDEQIRKMLADPNIMMVIPYHKSSLNPIVAEMTNVDAFTDYTDFQNTKDEEGKAVKRDFDWDGKLHKLSHGKDGKLLPKEQWGDIQDVVKEYADWCKARDYTPKFSQFLYMEDGSINPGYYKMLEDFSLLTVDGEFTPQDDVRMKFPTETDAFGSMADLIAEGLDADAVLEGKRSKKVVPIADEIEELAESGELLSDLNQRDVDIVKNFMETTDITKGHAPQFSLASDRDRELADLQKKIDRLQRDKRRTYGREAKEGDAVRVAKAILKDTSSDFSLNQTIKEIKNVFQMIKRGDDFAEIYGEIQGLSRSIADSSFDMVEIPGAREEAELRQRFLAARKRDGRPLKILIPQNMIGDFDRAGGWKEFRAAHKGIVTLSVNDGMSYDTFVDSIAEEFGEQYRGESAIDALINIIETADSDDARHPERKVYRDEDIEGSVPDDVDMGIMGGWRETEVNSIIDRLLDDISTEIAPDLTFADRKAQEKDLAVRKARENEREKWEARREKWKADRDKRIAEMKEDKKLAVEAQRAKGKERLRKQAEMYRRQRERTQQRRADNASRRKTLNRIYTTAQRLSKKLLTPTDSQHVPEKYRKAVAEVLGWLDFENARTDQWAKRHGNVPSDRILNLRKLRELYAGIANDDQLNQYIEPDDQVYEWMDMLSDLDGTRLDDLETDQLRTVRLILDAVAWQVNNADKMMTEGMKQNRADMATQIMDELAAQKGEKLADSTFKRLMKADSTPAHFFERLGSKTLQKLFKGLTDAQDRHIRNLSEAQDYIEKNVTSKWGNTRKVGPNNSLIKKWTEESQKYTLENGKTVEMTGAQVMSLYALNKREQARKHLLGGGIMIAPTKVKRNLKGGIKEYLLERELSKTRAQLTYADITGILGKMSQDQIDCAEAMLKYLKTTSEWGNETSMKMFGYRKFIEENYFPIQSAKEFIANSNLELQRDKKIKNQGMTKNVSEYANNPIVIDDFFDVTTAHINQMSQYNAFVPILEDFDRIYQYTEFNDKHIVQRSVKEMIEQKHGRWAADYIENLLKNVNGNFGNEVADIQGFEKLLRNWKAAKIGMSVRVLAQQPTAVVRAFNEISPKYFAGTPRKGSHKRMWEICPIAEWKNWGYAQTDIHRSMRDTMLGDKHISDKLFFDMYGKADNLGWGMIFDAVERETKDLMKKGKLNFEYDSAEYRQHVNERFRHIVDRTQVVDSVLHRSQLMRSQNTVTKAMTAFMAEPTITINTIMTSFTKAQEEFRAGNKKAGTKAAAKGVTVFVANAVAVSLMSSLISAIRESYLPDDDDDDKEKELNRIQQLLVDLGFEEGSLLYDWMSGYFIEDFKSNINPLCLMPITKDMINMLEGYDAPNPLYQLPESLIKNTQNIKKWIDEDGDTRYSGRYYIERAAESMAELFGIPASNIRKELIGFQNIYYRAISEKEYGDYMQDRWELNEEYKSNKNIFIDHYLNAKKAGHDESASDIKQNLLTLDVRDEEGNKVFTEDSIQKRAWSVYAPEYKDDVIAGKDVSKQEKDLKSVGVSQEDIDDKKSKALVSAISESVEAGDTKRIEDLYTSLEKYGYGEYDVDKKVKSAASDLMYDAIDAEDYEEAERYINVITDVTEYTRDDVVSSITTHYMSNYYEAMDAGDQNGVSRVTNILGKYGVSSNTIREKEAEHYKDYYRQKAYMAYSSGNTAEAYRIATEYNQKYPGVYSKGVDGMIYGIQNLSDDTIRRYTTSGKYDEWQLP